MGTHPIFESDFDCLSNRMALTESKSDTVINEEERVIAYKTTHDSVSLRWRAVKDAQVYMIEEKEAVGTGKVFVGHAQECTLRGLEPLTEHIYRMRCKTLSETTATPWLTVYTKKEPISCEHLIRACFSSDLMRLRSLIKELDAKGVTALMACAREDFVEGATYLLENEADINIVNHDFKSALTTAVLFGQDSIAELLLANGANVAVKDRSGSNLLFSAADSVKCLQVILGQDVIDPNERNDAGWTPLHKIASVNQTSSAAECVKTLIDNGAKIDIKDNNGNTPLCLAVIMGNVEACKMFLDLGASMSVCNSQNNSPQKLALANEFSKGARSREIANLFKNPANL